ncbi:hypothetical protein M501DRAFT_1003751 [Patellaria atrata CBS 101060]|uniref:GPI inositol-deacylase n=1 Tax=Patellaria atrata CBS 101060 TaxID=1346257 RepID=A0A9P4SAQ0_9PEZI|nr:hypothetical protein M501DRAFT_1003751 [Patellaria atrata CBS 101060]
MASGPSVFSRLRLRSDPVLDCNDDEGLANVPNEAERRRSESSSRMLSTVPTRLKSNILQRSASSACNTSTFALKDIRKSHIPERCSDGLGLQLVFDPPSHTGDIIFVHGLGGSAWKTWSWNRDTANFWPGWLSDEEDLSSFRTFTFGYDSDWKGAGTNLNISDFSKDLLLQMLTFRSDDRPTIGSKDIIFVAHSMGGLLVKRAYLLAKLDIQYSDIVSKFLGIIFLGTPHRGAQSAAMLNNILAALPLAPPPKAYLADLQVTSSALHEINEQFRHHCQELALISYYETEKTTLGMKDVLIVGKESAVLQYPKELSSPLYANHHTICKFQSRLDSNYVKVRDTIAYLAKRSSSRGGTIVNTVEDNQQIEAILGIHDVVEEDLKSAHNRVMDGTCQWLTHKPDFIKWQATEGMEDCARIFWLFGLPATGKTTLTSVVIDHLKTHTGRCQYHFFSTGHQMKRTAAYCLRSIAAQLARTNLEFREALFAFHAGTGIKFASQDQKFETIWEKIFEGIIFKTAFQTPLFWILDAIDEADAYSVLISRLMKIQSVTPIRVFLSSRPTEIVRTLGTHTLSITPLFLSDRDTENDIRTYVYNTMRNILPANEQVQKKISDQVLKKASGSFLWVRLALDSLRGSWYTQHDIQKSLTELPADMASLYEQMLEKIISQPSPRSRLLAKRILTWVACSWRPLRIDELITALEPEFSDFVNFEDTVTQICGNFVSIEEGRLSLIHATARSFLTSEGEGGPRYIKVRQSHSDMAVRCLTYLSKDDWRRLFRAFSPTDYAEAGHLHRPNRLLLAEQGFPLLGYSVCYWAYHVSNSPTFSAELTEALKTFFSRYCLSWIEAIALSANLRYLIKSAKYIKAYAKRKRLAKSRPESSPVLGSLKAVPEDDPKWLQSWATDIIRVVGKFGPILISNPASIYGDIPPFCPRNSMIWQTYGEFVPNQLYVSGLPTDGWDDRLASISVGDDRMISKVLATDAYFIILISSVGSITIWHAETCEQARAIELNEYTPIIALNKIGTLLAAASLTSYTIWEVSTGRLVSRIPKTTETRTTTVAFNDDSSQFTTCYDDCSIFSYDVYTSIEISRQIFTPPQVEYHSCPKVMSISPDHTTVAIGWRGKPPLIWHFKATPYQPVKIRKARQMSDSLCAPESYLWRPDGSSLFILCQDTNVIEWQLYDDQQIAYPHLNPREFGISRDGTLLLTCDNIGTISVWSFPKLSLVYQLKSENEFIRDITFSPDNQRIYDVRCFMCNIWEPDVLVRPDEQDLEDHSSVDEVASGSYLSNEPAIAHADTTQTVVTAISVSTTDDYYCCGSDDGMVIIHEATYGKAIRKVYGHPPSSAVLQLCWSESGRFMVSSDDSARVIAKRLEVKEKDKWGVFPVLDIRAPDSVQQFLFSSDERYLLVSTSSTDHIYDLRTKKQVCSRLWGTRNTRRWVQSPPGTNLLISVGPCDIQICNWSTLETESFADLISETDRDRGKLAVVWTACTTAQGHILYGTLPTANIRGSVTCLSHSGLHLEYIDFPRSFDSSLSSFASECNPNLAHRVKRLIGIYEGRVVYLDHDHRLCTWDLSIDGHELKRHFALPRDWLDVNSLDLAVVNRYGTMFCPRDGHVAIVRNGIRL